MNVGIVGLGLIGGSLAKAYKQDSKFKVYGYDADESIVEFAHIYGAVDLLLDKNSISKCDLLLLALYPSATIDWLNDNANLISKETVVIDMCGTKRTVCRTGFKLAEEYGFTFVGGHPMAGLQFSGFKNSSECLFRGASMIIVPPIFDDIEFLDKIKGLLHPVGFGRITVTTAEKHDEIIAFTSQLAHVVSNAFAKSPTAQTHKGFSAGSYKDLTRVACLNEEMWTELFLENRDHLINELDIFIENITKYKKTLLDNDYDSLKNLLGEGKDCKLAVDNVEKDNCNCF